MSRPSAFNAPRTSHVIDPQDLALAFGLVSEDGESEKSDADGDEGGGAMHGEAPNDALEDLIHGWDNFEPLDAVLEGRSRKPSRKDSEVFSEREIQYLTSSEEILSTLRALRDLKVFPDAVLKVIAEFTVI